MAHSHWPKDHPLAKTRICQLSKAECDAKWTAYLHHHEGEECVKRVEPGNKIATCVLRPGSERRSQRTVRGA